MAFYFCWFGNIFDFFDVVFFARFILRFAGPLGLQLTLWLIWFTNWRSSGFCNVFFIIK
jgi:hypothetical protein